MSVSKAVLITGCSSGIGRATAARLAAGGHTVYATARRPETLADLAAAGCRTLALDVTDEASMRAAVDAVEGGVGVLVNNAGYSQSGALETVAPEDVRRQFETNVFGVLRLTQLVLPGMREQRWGRIVNVGSMGGRLTFPGGGVYHATKHALEAISDALRFEVQGFGIDVVLVQPGLIRTGFADTAVAEIPEDRGPYAAFNAAVAASTREAYASGPLARLGGEADSVAAAIERAIGRPRPRVPVTPSARLLMGLRRVLPDRAWDAAMSRSFPRPRS